MAFAVLVVLVALLATVLGVIRWTTVGDDLPGWALGLVITVSTLVVVAVGAYAALIAIGGVTVLHRDSCEARGVPYAPNRPRERPISAMRAAVRRSIRPNAPWHPGEVVEVRSLPEIIATLDDRGCLDGMPFMPEMVVYCGNRFRVHRRVDKVWEYAHETGLRRVHGAVLLDGLRCDGGGHGGCQSGCQLIWKEAWLRRPGTRLPEPVDLRRIDLQGCAQTSVDGQQRYVCQMTEIVRASTQLSQRDPRHYIRDLVGGNVRLGPLLVVLSVRVFNSVQWRLKGARWPVLTPLDSASSPHEASGIQAGELVRVKSKRDIAATLNRTLRNRGLEFGTDMLFCCGASHRVAARVERVMNERTGELLVMKNPSILLEGAHANGGTVLTPQNEYFFWREIWLEPQRPRDEQEHAP